MENSSQLETLAVEYNAVREEIRAHTTIIKEALVKIQDSKDQITVLATRLNELQAQYFELTKGKEVSNDNNTTKESPESPSPSEKP